MESKSKGNTQIEEEKQFWSEFASLHYKQPKLKNEMENPLSPFRLFSLTWPYKNFTVGRQIFSNE